MNKAGYHKCRACQKGYLSPVTVEKRKAFALDHGSWQLDRWKQVEFEHFI